MRSETADLLLRDVAVFEDGSGGFLEIDGKIGAGSPLRLSGKAQMRDFVVHEDAKLEALLIGAELQDVRATLREDGISFDKVRAPFSYADGRLKLKDATANGPQIGVNLSGDYVFESDRLDFKGVFTPLYAINSALGKIPLLGDILTGGDGQGVFAFNFSVKGSSADPDVSVNPLSVLTPGILRRIFNGDGASQALDTSNGRERETGDR